MAVWRVVPLLALAVLLAGGCGVGEDTGSVPKSRTDWSRATVPLEEIEFPGREGMLSPRDALLPIYTPKFESVAEADGWLDPFEPVLAFEWRGDARAYPIQMLIRHEIVNDTVGGKPVAITY